jgi:ribosomal protein S12 methylthiotransferase accessory factor YcaO
MIHFSMQHKTTQSATGYFRPSPLPEPSFENLFFLCQARPEDPFLRSFLLEKILHMDPQHRSQMPFSKSPFFLHALREAQEATGIPTEPDQTSGHSPLAYLRIPQDPSRQAWIRVLHDNIFRLKIPHTQKPFPLPLPKLSGPALPSAPVPIDKIPLHAPPCPPVPGPMDVFYAAMERLKPHRHLLASEKRHTASLSPIAILREWELDRSVDIPGYEHRLTGLQTSYGRGLSLDSARVACLMEAAERITAFAGVAEGRIALRLNPTPIRRALFSELQQENLPALDPNTLLLEAPMPDLPLWWMPGERITHTGRHSCLVPVQCVVLFSNLPEAQLFTALGSTGFAAGASEEGARLSGLLEVIERDAEATMPHTPSNCFRIQSEDPEVQNLFQAYENHGIHPFFEDITTEFGIPSYRCLVLGKDGAVIRGTGTHLSGKKALLSALTETPWPFPGPPSCRPDFPLACRHLETFADFSTNNPAADLKRVEDCLVANGYNPIHVPLTREDLRIPVVRSLVPGLEILGDFDRFSAVNRRLFTRYQQMFNMDKNG